MNHKIMATFAMAATLSLAIYSNALANNAFATATSGGNPQNNKNNSSTSFALNEDCHIY
jgi:hypothetical protein